MVAGTGASGVGAAVGAGMVAAGGAMSLLDGLRSPMGCKSTTTTSVGRWTCCGHGAPCEAFDPCCGKEEGRGGCETRYDCCGRERGSKGCEKVHYCCKKEVPNRGCK